MPVPTLHTTSMWGGLVRFGERERCRFQLCTQPACTVSASTKQNQSRGLCVSLGKLGAVGSCYNPQRAA